MDFKQMKAELNEKGTQFVELEPCEKALPDGEKCGCTYYYAREGRRHNGCIACHANAKQESANAYQQFPIPYEADEFGTPVRMGRRCNHCGGNVRLGVAAYGKKEGACRDCALEVKEKKDFGLKLMSLNRLVNAKLHKFVVRSMERSGVVEVAPRNMAEYIELKDLVYRCQVANDLEREAKTGIQWEIGHKYPAAGTDLYDELRGRATVENLYLIQSELNRAEGRSVAAGEWETLQVVSIEECRRIGSELTAASAWKEAKGEWLTIDDKAKETLKQKDEEYQARVREILNEPAKPMVFFTMDILPSFDSMLLQVEADWARVQSKMNSKVEKLLIAGNCTDWKVVKDQKLTIDAFHGANAKLHAVVMTLRQVADAGGRDNDLKRCAVLWCLDVMKANTAEVQGFTHPKLAQAWGVYRDEDTGRSWMCAWGKPALDAEKLTPFDGEDAIKAAHERDAAALMETKDSPPLVEESFSFDRDTWKGTFDHWMYELESDKARRIAKEQALAEEKAKTEAYLCGVVKSERESLLRRWEGAHDELVKFAFDEWGSYEPAFAEAMAKLSEKAHQVWTRAGMLQEIIDAEDVESERKRYQMIEGRYGIDMTPDAVFGKEMISPF